MKKRTRKSPFVVTVAFATAVTACGGSTFRDEDGTGGDGGKAGSGGKSGSGGKAGSSAGGNGAGGSSGSSGSSGSAGDGGAGGSGGGCPTTMPGDGTACAIEGGTCSYVRCYAPLWQTDMMVTCEKGSWRQGFASCNPPPPPQCPPSVPSHGTACSMPADMLCSYSTNPCCPPQSARCLNGFWQALNDSCNPPPPLACPTDPPAHGSSCAPSDPCSNPWRECTYATCPDGTAQTKATCNGNIWQVSGGCAVDAGASD